MDFRKIIKDNKVLLKSFVFFRALYCRFFIFSSLKRKKRIKWWLVYGPHRTGTTYMYRFIRRAARLGFSDRMEQVTAIYEQNLQKKESLKVVKGEIINIFSFGGGRQLDLVLKQAVLELKQYELLIRLLGEPERIIFCLREPADYIRSYKKKFPDGLQHMEQRYLNSLAVYEHIGGGIFEYSHEEDTDKYLYFLRPLKLNKRFVEPFAGNKNHGKVSVPGELELAYNNFKKKNKEKIFNFNSRRV